ncbi:MAG: AAA family ATPase [Thermoplasmata archaeon]|nr:AAA family ATPase [Thermoplasmata archaeon]MCI4338467.1 AAA family ATPase [Thermoplasmata archaeon]MCI4341049.1 AAA family ATPase [Thermoplasmata archaeon]
MSSILLREETLDPSFVPPALPGREKEFAALLQRYRGAVAKGLSHPQLLTGGIGSGKTALARRLGEDLRRISRAGTPPLQTIYINCWRRANDRSILLELLRSVNVSLPDRGYSLTEMLDVFEQGLRRTPGPRLIVLDEVSALVRQGTKLVYFFSRAREIALGSVSLLLIAPEDVLPLLDGASRSSFGLTHRLHLDPYDEAALLQILLARATIALRPGSFSAETLAPLARAAAPRGDARFAMELLANAARAAENDGRNEIGAEDVRQARSSLVPGESELRLDELPPQALLALLAVARTLRGPRSGATTERIRQTYGTLVEEFGATAVSRVTFWRTIRQLEREGLIELEPASVGRPARVTLSDVPVSHLEMLLESRLERAKPKSRSSVRTA